MGLTWAGGGGAEGPLVLSTASAPSSLLLRVYLPRIGAVLINFNGPR